MAVDKAKLSPEMQQLIDRLQSKPAEEQKKLGLHVAFVYLIEAVKRGSIADDSIYDVLWAIISVAAVDAQIELLEHTFDLFNTTDVLDSIPPSAVLAMAQQEAVRVALARRKKLVNLLEMTYPTRQEKEPPK